MYYSFFTNVLQYFNVDFDSSGILFLLPFFDIPEKHLQFRKKAFVEENFWFTPYN